MSCVVFYVSLRKCFSKPCGFYVHMISRSLSVESEFTLRKVSECLVTLGLAPN
jgi:hypothetical protein